MSVWVVVAGVLGGLGIFLVVRELIPAPARLDAALARLDSAPVPGRRTSVSLRLAQHVSAELPWLPTPTADLALLGQDRDTWIASKITCGLLGLAVPPVLLELHATASDPVRVAVASAARRYPRGVIMRIDARFMGEQHIRNR